MMYLTEDFEGCPSRVRANFINKLGGVKSPFLLGSIGLNGVANLSIISSFLHLGSNPALFGMVLRPKTPNFSHSLTNIEQNHQFTISSVERSIFRQAHLSSAKLSVDESEFDFTNLTKWQPKVPDWNVPAVKESLIKMGLMLDSIVRLPNNCVFVISKLCWIEVNDKLLSDKYELQLTSDQMVVSGLYSYYDIHHVDSLSYVEV